MLRVGAAYVLTAWLVIQVVETIFPAFGFSDAAVRYVTIAFAIGLLPALVLAWVFEFTPDGLRKDAQISDSGTVSIQNAKRLDRIILIILAIALGYFAFDKFVLDPVRDVSLAESARQQGRTEALVESYGEQSIAVLAFRDMSPDGDQEYLADGIAEEILNLLARIPELRVISRSSAFSYKNKEVEIPTIAAQLNVAHVLEGSVRKSGNRIRITAQLIEARSDTHLWSETYDRVLEDVFAIEDEIAAALVDQMKVVLLGDLPQTRKIDPDAYFLYLQGYHLVYYSEEEKAIDLFKQALAIQPDYADAWLGISLGYWTISSYSEPGTFKDETRQLSQNAFDIAARLNPDHPAVLAYAAWQTMEDGDYVSAARQFEHALSLHPHHFEVLRTAAVLATVIGRYDVATVLAEISVIQDPLCTTCVYRYSRILFSTRQYTKALQEIDRYRKVTPEPGGEMTMGAAMLLTGDSEGALKVFSERSAEADQLYGSLLVHIVKGDLQDPAQALEDYGQRFGDRHSLRLAELYATAGKVDQGMAWLQKATLDMEAYRIAGVLDSPFLENLRRDPRWLALQEKAGVAPHQLEKIEFNPRLPLAMKSAPE